MIAEHHAAQVPLLPVFACGSRLVLRTDPGENGDTAWDWSYVSRMEIKQGHYAANLFPEFQPRAGWRQRMSTQAVVELDQQKCSHHSMFPAQ